MQKLIIFAAIAACCVAAPSSLNRNEPKPPADVPLERPSPINPELPMPPKPAEKITLITDPVELAKHKREIVESTHHATFAQIAPALSLTPINPTPTNDHTEEPSTTQKPDQQVQREKREEQVLVDSKKVQPLKPVEKPTSTTAKPTTEAPTSSTPRRTYSPRTTYVPRKSKPTTEMPTNQRQARELQSSSPQSAEISAPKPLIFQNTASEHKVPLQIPRGPPIPTHTNAKRDIPVPLVPKHPHPEESPKESEESDESEESGEKKKPEVKPHEQKPNEQHKKDEHPFKVSVKREDVQIEALSSPVVPAAKPAGEHVQVTTSQQQDVKTTQHHEQVTGQQHGNLQLHNLHHQFQHAEQTQSQSHVAHDVPHNQHKYDHQVTQQQHSFQPEHTHVASTTQKTDVLTSADSASSSTSSTTEHPLFRTKPVPVAELFARSHH